MRSFGLRSAFPNLDAHAYDWRVDRYEPHRVWFTTRVTGTQAGELRFGSKAIKATGRSVQGAPECNSYTFNAAGEATSFTGGYVIDRRVGNTKGLGAVFGILAAIGAPVPRPGSLGWVVASALNRARLFVSAVVGRLLGRKEE